MDHRGSFRDIASPADLRWHLRSEAAARRLLEWLVWPAARRCAHCGGVRSWRLKGGRAGLHECAGCHRQFTATTPTPLHATRLPIATWLQVASWPPNADA